MSVTLKGVSKIFKNQQVAVNNLNLNIAEGEIVCLLGPSGCGKTTTLRIIAGFERPTSGSLFISGVEVAGGGWIPPEKRQIGMVFQDYALFPHLNVQQNISFGLKVGDKESQDKVGNLVEMVGLEGLLDRFPHQLSGGQQQRVAMARAMARNPVILLLDEPFSNLDAVLRLEMREEVKRVIKQAGLTAIFVTHDLQDALAVADRIVVMRNGEIQQSGTPVEVYRRPQSVFVATFLGRFSLVAGKVSSNKGILTGMGQFNLEHEITDATDVFLAIPPEAIQVRPEGKFSGVIKGSRYLGDKWEATIIVTGGLGQRFYLKIFIYGNSPGEQEKVRFDLDYKEMVILAA